MRSALIASPVKTYDLVVFGREIRYIEIESLICFAADRTGAFFFFRRFWDFAALDLEIDIFLLAPAGLAEAGGDWLQAGCDRLHDRLLSNMRRSIYSSLAPFLSCNQPISLFLGRQKNF